MPKKKLTLFEGNDDDDQEEGELPINKAYAAKYEEWRRGEELSKLKNLYGDDATLSSSESETSDDDFVEPDNPEFDRDFLVCMGALHKKELLSEKDKFFTGDYRKKKPEGEKEEAMTIRDYQHHIIFERQGELDEEVDGEPHRSSKVLLENTGTKFEDGMSSDDDDDDGDGLLTSGLFKVKVDDNKDEKHKLKKLDDDAVAFVKGENTSLSNTSDRKLLEGLRTAWNSPHLPKEDKWLADFFLNKRYLEDEDESIEREYNEVIIDEETVSEDEKTLDTMEDYETKYRFRYEEPDKEFIKKYPRCIQESVRPKDERRKLKHQAIKQRKLQEKEIKKQEIERLKALKYREIQAKLEKIKEVSGNEDIDFGDDGLDEDFDPEAHDSAMSRMFGEDYYTQDDGSEEKPAFEYGDDVDVIKDYDDWLEKEQHSTSQQVEDEASGAHEGYEYDPDFNMDADYDEESYSKQDLQMMMKNSSRKKGRKWKSKFAKVLAKQKPVFDPQEKKFEAYFDEYYQLDFEDIVGGMPCRFQYRQVQPNNFGLSTGEILSAQDKELNKWYSVRKLLRYDRTEDQEQRDNSMYSHRATIEKVKKRVLPSLFNRGPEETNEAEQEKKRIKNLKKKLRRQQKQGQVEDITNSPLLEPRERQEILTDAGSEEKPPLVQPLDDTGKAIKGKKAKKVDRGKSVERPAEGTVVESARSGKNSLGSPTNAKKRKRKRVDEDGKTKTKMVKKEAVDESTDRMEHSPVEVCGKSHDAVDSPTKRKKKKKKKKPLHAEANGQILPGLSDVRLAAYGQNPKQLKRKAKFGKSNFEGKVSEAFVQ